MPLRTRLLELITDLQHEALSGAEPRFLFRRSLQALLTVTQSAHGFIGEVSRTPEGAPYLRTFIIADADGNEAEVPSGRDGGTEGLEFHHLDNLFGAAIRTGEVVISNDPASDPRSGGTPEGHPPLRAFMALPLVVGFKVVGLVGLANRSGGYSEDLAANLRPLVTTATAILQADQIERARRRAEEEIREQKERLALVIAGTGVGLWDWHVQTGAVVFNERWAEIVGHTLAELGPISIQTWIDLCHPDDLAVSNALLADVFSRKSPIYLCDARMRHKDGRWVWVRDSGRVIEWDADGRPWRMVGTHLDITEEKQSLEQITGYRNQLEAILAAAPDGVMTVDERLRITRFNPAAERLFDRSAAEVLGEPLSMLMSPDMQPQHDGLAQRFLSEPGLEGRPMANWRTVQGRRRDGGTFPMSVTLSRTSLNGQPTAIAIMRDMTVIELQKHDLQDMAFKLTEQLRAAQEANAAKTRFLASMSHELRTPLNAIIGFADLLSSDIADTLVEPKRKDYAADILNAGRHLLSLIEDILDMARIEERRLELSLESHSPTVLIAEAVRISQPVLADNGLAFSLDVPADLPQVRADARAVRQIVINLLGNAAKFTPRGGRVQLRATRDGGAIRVTVQDTGRGIPRDKLPLLGMPFVQVGDPMIARGGGVGLGLAISRQLVELMGGSLTVESEYGAWTRVGFSLPIA